jgi:chromosomal replication initiator protein
MGGTNASASRWGEILEVIRGQINQQQFESWFRKLAPISVNEELVRLAVPNIFLKEWLDSYYPEIIRKAAKAVLGGNPLVEINVMEGMPENFDACALPEMVADSASPAQPFQTPVSFGPSDMSGLRRNPCHPNFLSDVLLNPSYVFDTFVIGPSNKLPHAAAVAVAEQPANAYNPLFLHGSVGLGKSHLLQAVCHSLLARRKDMRVLYLSCEFFTNHFITAVKSGDLRDFRDRYRRADVLVIDDINFLARKEQTQEEFFHTFNALYNSGKQIILSSDNSPKDIPTLEERLVSRFRWGLVAEIEGPDFETRMLILKAKSRLHGSEFPSDVCEFIAERFAGNIRELEGAILKVLSVAKLHRKPIDVSLTRDAIRPLTAPARRKISVERILSVVVNHYQVRQADLQSRSRSRSIAFPRQVCMYLARRLTNHSLEEIGGYFGGRDHTTVLYANEKISQMWGHDRKFKDEVEAIVREIEG